MKVACTVLEGESGGNPADLLRNVIYMIEQNINNNEAEKVHFAVMAIGAAADLMGITPSEMHNRLDKVGLVKNLLFDLYDVEHTQSLEYVAEDVVEALNNWEKT